MMSSRSGFEILQPKYVSSLNFMGEQFFVQKGPSVFSIEWYYLI
jgi:hypothetical protein